MNETSRMSGLFRNWSRYLLCGIGLLVLLLCVSPVEGRFEYDLETDTTPVGTVIENAKTPDNRLPAGPGEMVMIARNRDGGDTTYMTPAEVSASVDTLAFPHLIPEHNEHRMLPGASDIIDIEAWNLGNAPDEFSLSADTSVAGETGIESIRLTDVDGDTIDSTGRIESIVDSMDTKYIGLEIDLDSNFEADTITIVAETSHPDSAWVDSKRGRGADTVVIPVTAEEPEPLYFREEKYVGRTDEAGEPLGMIRAEQPSIGDTLPVSIWSEDKYGDKLTGSELDIVLEEDEDADIPLYELEFGFTEGHSRFDEHPALEGKTPFLEVRGETTYIRASVNTDVMDAALAGEDTTVWTPDPDPDHIDTLDEVRTWPSPFKPLEGDPFVFQDLPADDGMEIFLYNVQGQMVRRLTVGRGIDFRESGNKARWWGKNDRGSYVASGTYVYVIKSQYGVERGKVTLVK